MPNINQIKEKSWIIILFSIFLFSFILDLYLLTRYNLSYGRDGPFYDLQVLKIIETGFTTSNDPPLVYYLLTPFVLILGNSFLGIKIAMALFGSLMAFPAFFLTETFNKNGSKVPSFLSAFLITVNISYFAMIGDFMQNLVGVFFLLCLLYFLVKWLENTRNWKYGTITIFLLVCCVLTHIYTGMLAVVIFVSIILLNTIIKFAKTRKLPLFDLKIFALISVLILGGLSVMFLIYPVMFSKVTTVISFFNGTSNNTLNSSPMSSTSMAVFLTIPFLLGVFTALKIIYNGLKEKIDLEETYPKNLDRLKLGEIYPKILSKETILAIIYLIMAFVLILLAAVPSEYQSRFILLAFVPIALIVPLGLQLIESFLNRKYPSKNGLRIGLISIIAILFAISSFYTASEEFSSMGPSISSEQYNALLKIKADYVGSEIGPNSVIEVNEYHMGYWVQYVLGVNVVTGNTGEKLSNNSNSTDNSTIYQIQITENQVQNSNSNSNSNLEYFWNPFLPYDFPIGFDFNLNSNQESNGVNSHSNPPNNLNSNFNSNGSSGNKSNGPPGINASNQNNNLIGNVSFNTSNAPPNGFGNSSNTLVNGIGPNGINRGTVNEGTLIFSLNNVKIYKIS